LEAAGHDPLVIDRHHGPRIDIAAWPGQLQTALSGCQAVIHLAGTLGTSELFDRLDEAVAVNCRGFANLVRCCETEGLQLVAIRVPDVWLNPYQATKRFQHDLAEAWRIHRGLKVSYVRAYNVFGPGQKVHGVRKMIPTWATAGWRGQPIEVYGDGLQQVDLVHVDDVARMLVDALQFTNGETFEAGTGHGHTALEVARVLADWTDRGSRVTHVPMRAGEHEHTRLVADPLANVALGWTPQWSQGELYETVAWYRQDRP
jgi:UDP-glucose 4-epimerase